MEDWADVEESQKLDVDYIGVSPVFPTPTKTDTKGAWGLAGLAKIKAFSRHPLVAIGGINESRSHCRGSRLHCCCIGHLRRIRSYRNNPQS